jgi:hypothetical protein
MIRTPIHQWPTVADLHDVPNYSGIYAFVSDSGEVLYIGESAMLRVRLLSHRTPKKFKCSYRVHYFLVDMKRYWRRGEYERELIRHYRPRFNRMSNPTREAVKPVGQPDVDARERAAFELIDFLRVSARDLPVGTIERVTRRLTTKAAMCRA